MTKRTTKVTILSALLAGGLSAGGWIAGCSTDPVESGPPSQNLGNVSIGLVVGVDVTLNTVTYTITGPAGYNRMGSIDVSQQLGGQRDHQRDSRSAPAIRSPSRGRPPTASASAWAPRRST